MNTFPMGIDYNKFTNAPILDMVREKTDLKKQLELHKKGADKNLLSIDRLDYTKGVVNRIGLELFLSKYPQYLEKFVWSCSQFPPDQVSRTIKDSKKKPMK